MDVNQECGHVVHVEWEQTGSLVHECRRPGNGREDEVHKTGMVGERRGICRDWERSGEREGKLEGSRDGVIVLVYSYSSTSTF